jgi:trans-4-hydroxy-L-proline dehydratase
MEQRSPGHTVLDDKIYRKGMLDFRPTSTARLAALDYLNDPEAYDKQEQLKAMAHLRRRHDPLRRAPREKARELAARRPTRSAGGAGAIAEVCRHVPAHAPRDFWEALQYYWFVHLGVTTELNPGTPSTPAGWTSTSTPSTSGAGRGHADPRAGRGAAAVLLDQVQQPAGAAQGGVTAAESGTYTDFARSTSAGVRRTARTGSTR